MTQRERVLAAIQHRQPDKVPYNIDFTQRAYQEIVAFTGDPGFAATLDNCLAAAEAGPVGEWREVAPDIWEDPFGVQWDCTVDKDIGTVCNVRVSLDRLDDYAFPEPADLTDRIAPLAQSGRFVIANLGFSLFERAWTLAGMETILMGMIAEPRTVHELFDRILAFDLRVIDHACSLDIDGMMFGDDWGQQRGLLMGPALWREFIKPRIRQMYARAKAAGKYVFIHSCGKVDAVFPELIELGLDVFNPFQPEVMDVYQMKRRFGDALCFYGGISTQRLLPFGTPDEVREEVRRLLDVVGENGGYIAAPAHSIPADARPENILATIEALQGQ